MNTKSRRKIGKREENPVQNYAVVRRAQPHTYTALHIALHLFYKSLNFVNK